jgi:hypothetical protein
MSELIPTEYEEQVAVVQYLTLKGHKHSSIPNSTWTTSFNQKRKNKAMGLNAGLPDLVTIINDNVVWIEMKRTKGGVLSQAQKDWIAALEEAGQTVWVCKGASEAIKKIQQLEKEW